MNFPRHLPSALMLLGLLFVSISAAAADPSPALPDTTAPAAPVPTEPTPIQLPPLAPIPLGRGFLLSGALDMRYRTSDSGRTNTTWINLAELDVSHPLTTKGRAFGNFFFQVLGQNPADISQAHDYEIGEAYLLYKLPIGQSSDSTAYLKVGQFQVPFALLGVYDPHLGLSQPLYAEALGIRTDWGAEVVGRLYGYLDYEFSLTAGSGPDHADIDPNRVVCFRLARNFVTRNGTVTVGGSLLTGRLPITDINADHPFAVELPPSGRVHADQGYISKSRIAGDGTYHYKNVLARAEFMAGADEDQRVLGYYLEANYGFSRRASVQIARSLWIYPQGNSNSTRDALGLSYQIGAHTSLSSLYEDLRDVPRDQSGRHRHRFIVQLLLRF